MRVLKFLSIAFFLACLTFGTMVACDGDDGDGGDGGELAGETICDDEIDNDEDGDTDCEDIDCILDPACEVTCDDIIAAYCDKAVECNGLTFEDCLIIFDGFLEAGFDCETIVDLPTAPQCVEDIENMDCDDNDNFVAPESCFPVGVCDECEVDEDCPDGLFCFDCAGFCTGVVSRCGAINFFAECPDGLFRTQE